MTLARAAEVLRQVTPLRWPPDTPEALAIGAEALELLGCLVAPDHGGSLNITIFAAKWNGRGSFLDFARAEWEKESRTWPARRRP
jgi:hypothetical protein